MRKSSIILTVVLLLGLVGWGYTYQKYKQLMNFCWDMKNELSRVERMLYSQHNSDLPYEEKTDKEVLEMLPPPDKEYLVEYHKDVPALFYEVWNDLLVDGVDTVMIKVFEWEFDRRITNLNKLHIDFVQKNGEWVVNYAGRWDPEVVMF